MSNFKITVPNPCYKNLSDMDIIENGRFCHSCNKDVIDFTKMSQAELQAYFASYKTEICGTIYNSQLAELNLPKYKTYFGLKMMIASGIALLSSGKLFSAPLVSGNKNIVYEISNTDIKNKGYKDNSIDTLGYKITGIVFDDEGKPLIGASIRIKNEKVSYVADFNGKFSFIVNGVKGGKTVLNISFIGFKTKDLEITLGDIKPEYKILMEQEIVVHENRIIVGKFITGTIATIKATDLKKTKKPTFFKRCINSIKKLF